MSSSQRISAWLRRIPRQVGAPTVVEVRDGDVVLAAADATSPDGPEEIAAALEELAVSQGRTVAVTIYALDAEGKALARMPCRASIPAPVTTAEGPPAAVLQNVIARQLQALETLVQHVTTTQTTVLRSTADALLASEKRRHELETALAEKSSLLDAAMLAVEQADGGGPRQQLANKLMERLGDSFFAAPKHAEEPNGKELTNGQGDA